MRNPFKPGQTVSRRGNVGTVTAVNLTPEMVDVRYSNPNIVKRHHYSELALAAAPPVRALNNGRRAARRNPTGAGEEARKARIRDLEAETQRGSESGPAGFESAGPEQEPGTAVKNVLQAQAARDHEEELFIIRAAHAAKRANSKDKVKSEALSELRQNRSLRQDLDPSEKKALAAELADMSNLWSVMFEDFYKRPEEELQKLGSWKIKNKDTPEESGEFPKTFLHARNLTLLKAERKLKDLENELYVLLSEDPKAIAALEESKEEAAERIGAVLALAEAGKKEAGRHKPKAVPISEYVPADKLKDRPALAGRKPQVSISRMETDPQKQLQVEGAAWLTLPDPARFIQEGSSRTPEICGNTLDGTMYVIVLQKQATMTTIVVTDAIWNLALRNSNKGTPKEILTKWAEHQTGYGEPVEVGRGKDPDGSVIPFDRNLQQRSRGELNEVDKKLVQRAERQIAVLKTLLEVTRENSPVYNARTSDSLLELIKKGISERAARGETTNVSDAQYELFRLNLNKSAGYAGQKRIKGADRECCENGLDAVFIYITNVFSDFDTFSVPSLQNLAALLEELERIGYPEWSRLRAENINNRVAFIEGIKEHATTKESGSPRKTATDLAEYDRERTEYWKGPEGIARTGRDKSSLGSVGMPSRKGYAASSSFVGRQFGRSRPSGLGMGLSEEEAIKPGKPIEPIPPEAKLFEKTDKEGVGTGLYTYFKFYRKDTSRKGPDGERQLGGLSRHLQEDFSPTYVASSGKNRNPFFTWRPFTRPLNKLSENASVRTPTTLRKEPAGEKIAVDWPNGNLPVGTSLLILSPVSVEKDGKAWLNVTARLPRKKITERTSKFYTGWVEKTLGITPQSRGTEYTTPPLCVSKRSEIRISVAHKVRERVKEMKDSFNFVGNLMASVEDGSKVVYLENIERASQSALVNLPWLVNWLRQCSDALTYIPDDEINGAVAEAIGDTDVDNRKLLRELHEIEIYSIIKSKLPAGVFFDLANSEPVPLATTDGKSFLSKLAFQVVDEESLGKGVPQLKSIPFSAELQRDRIARVESEAEHLTGNAKKEKLAELDILRNRSANALLDVLSQTLRDVGESYFQVSTKGKVKRRSESTTDEILELSKRIKLYGEVDKDSDRGSAWAREAILKDFMLPLMVIRHLRAAKVPVDGDTIAFIKERAGLIRIDDSFMQKIASAERTLSLKTAPEAAKNMARKDRDECLRKFKDQDSVRAMFFLYYGLFGATTQRLLNYAIETLSVYIDSAGKIPEGYIDTLSTRDVLQNIREASNLKESLKLERAFALLGTRLSTDLGKVEIYYTYNPLLFMITRDTWKGKGIWTKSAAEADIKMATSTLNDVDAIGRYGYALKLVYENALGKNTLSEVRSDLSSSMGTQGFLRWFDERSERPLPGMPADAAVRDLSYKYPEIHQLQPGEGNTPLINQWKKRLQEGYVPEQFAAAFALTEDPRGYLSELRARSFSALAANRPRRKLQDTLINTGATPKVGSTIATYSGKVVDFFELKAEFEREHRQAWRLLNSVKSAYTEIEKLSGQLATSKHPSSREIALYSKDLADDQARIDKIKSQLGSWSIEAAESKLEDALSKLNTLPKDGTKYHFMRLDDGRIVYVPKDSWSVTLAATVGPMQPLKVTVKEPYRRTPLLAEISVKDDVETEAQVPTYLLPRSAAAAVEDIDTDVQTLQSAIVKRIKFLKDLIEKAERAGHSPKHAGAESFAREEAEDVGVEEE